MAGKIYPVYLLLGPEIGEKAALINEIEEKLKKEHAGGTAKNSFYPQQDSLVDFIATARNGSLFAGHNLLFVKQADRLTQEQVELLAAYCKNPAGSTTLIITSDQTKISDKIKNAVPQAGSRIFWEMFEEKKASWMRSFFKSQNLQISSEAVDSIVSLVEGNTLALRDVCQRLVLLQQRQGGGIDLKLVEEYLFHSREETVFSLFAALVSANHNKAAEIAASIFAAGEVAMPQLAAGLLWQYRNLLKIKILQEQDMAFEQCCRAAGVRGKLNTTLYHNACRNFNRRQIQRIISRIVELDRATRELNKSIHLTLLLRAIYQIAIKKGTPFSD